MTQWIGVVLVVCVFERSGVSSSFIRPVPVSEFYGSREQTTPMPRTRAGKFPISKSPSTIAALLRQVSDPLWLEAPLRPDERPSSAEPSLLSSSHDTFDATSLGDSARSEVTARNYLLDVSVIERRLKDSRAPLRPVLVDIAEAIRLVTETLRSTSLLLELLEEDGSENDEQRRITVLKHWDGLGVVSENAVRDRMDQLDWRRQDVYGESSSVELAADRVDVSGIVLDERFYGPRFMDILEDMSDDDVCEIAMALIRLLYQQIETAKETAGSLQDTPVLAIRTQLMYLDHRPEGMMEDLTSRLTHLVGLFTIPGLYAWKFPPALLATVIKTDQDAIFYLTKVSLSSVSDEMFSLLRKQNRARRELDTSSHHVRSSSFAGMQDLAGEWDDDDDDDFIGFGSPVAAGRRAVGPFSLPLQMPDAMLNIRQHSLQATPLSTVSKDISLKDHWWPPMLPVYDPVLGLLGFDPETSDLNALYGMAPEDVPGVVDLLAHHIQYYSLPDEPDTHYVRSTAGAETAEADVYEVLALYWDRLVEVLQQDLEDLDDLDEGGPDEVYEGTGAAESRSVSYQSQSASAVPAAESEVEIAIARGILSSGRAILDSSGSGQGVAMVRPVDPTAQQRDRIALVGARQAATSLRERLGEEGRK